MKLLNRTQSLFTVFLFLVSITNVVGQSMESKIDTSNYYDFYVNVARDHYYYTGKKGESNNVLSLKGKRITTAWLTNLDVTPIIIEELKLAGYKYPADNAILKNNDDQVLLVNAYCGNEKFGVLYLTGHDSSVSSKHRLVKTPLHLPQGIAYMERIFNGSGESEFIKFKTMPQAC